ncbi:MAG: 1-(5-phosphoribosyl)-5-[(5-phosphoribosylamino)methylideneamino]imidazole-4-carboxamide isomerase [Candidatus Metalachnospira sp.]|nr:1-(5-phosphoribosyl)-5-[(5-phosphoribosylamino)methylideneamino]imidazole-4-carboxamide isomerase [Candidatus Metalachnospira sp.]
MYIIPAIDLYNGCAVRLKKGDYDQMTTYSDNPPEFAEKFQKCGAEYLHVVDLEGAKDGTTANIETVKAIVEKTSMKVEIGGGIRSDEVVEKYINIGVSRVILGTAAVEDRGFLKRMVEKYGEKIAVGVDIRDGLVAIKGWLETTELRCFDFCAELEQIGVKTVICTDISKDGMLGGTNTELYKEMNERFNIDIVASGGVSTLADIKKLSEMNMYGAILGKALYENALDLTEAIKTAKGAAE